MADTKDLNEILGKISSGETSLYCAKHFYTPSKVSQPTKGCSDCWRVLYWSMYAKTPADDRENFVAGMDALVHHIIEHDKAGTWDFKPSFSVNIEKEN